MATSITMPQLGEAVAGGTIGRWLKQPGDHVERGEQLAEIINDKVNAELPSPVAGQLEGLLVEEGATVAVGTPIARIDDAGNAGAPSPGIQPLAVTDHREEPAPLDVGMFAGTLESLDAPLAPPPAPTNASAAALSPSSASDGDE